MQARSKRLEERQLDAGRALQTNVEIVPGRLGRPRDLHCSSSDEPFRERGAVGNLDRNADRPCDPPPDLDRVDSGGLAFVDQLERRATGVEQRDAPTFGRVHRQLLEPERVPVELDRCVEVVDGQDEAELHTDPSCLTSTTARASMPERSADSGATTASKAPPGGASKTCPARARAPARCDGSSSTTTTS